MSIAESAMLELNQLTNRFDDISFKNMDAKDFGALLARIYGCVRNYKNSKAAHEKSTEVLGKACALLESVQAFHVSHRISTSQAMVETFEAAVKLVKEILWLDFRIDEAACEQAIKIQSFLRAVKACGITPPGHPAPFTDPRFGGNKPVDTDALEFAAANVIEYTLFLNEGYRKGMAPLDPFTTDMAIPLQLYLRLQSLVPNRLMLVGGFIESNGA